MIIRGGTFVTVRGVERAEIAIENGVITEVGPAVQGGGEEIDASGLHIFPGGIDSHVHFNEPGRTDWEDIAHGSAALAAGGYTSFIEMPLNSIPVTTDVKAFDLKLAAMQKSSSIDFGLWGGLLPNNLNQVQPLVQRGVTGFKAFMCPSGIDEFPACNARALQEGMRRIAALDSILLLHAEDPGLLSDPKGPTAGDFLESRPIEAEINAVGHAGAWAGSARCRLHIVHLSNVAAAAAVEVGRERGIDISGETCPHYLLYADEDLERLGGKAKCAPPLRPRRSADEMWNLIADGTVGMVVSDHSPCTADLKQGQDFRRIWGGISGCQSTRQLLLAQNRLSLPAIAAVTATNVARRFRLAGKGDIAPGFDADLWVADLNGEDVVRREDLLYKNPFSVHEGQKIRGRTVRTLVRGHDPGRGRFIRPALR